MIDCRSPEGITVGLIDALISISRILANRDLTPPGVQEALKDLAEDEDIAKVLYVANLTTMRKDINEWAGYEIK